MVTRREYDEFIKHVEISHVLLESLELRRLWASPKPPPRARIDVRCETRVYKVFDDGNGFTSAADFEVQATEVTKGAQQRGIFQCRFTILAVYEITGQVKVKEDNR